mmetsp:Transcript_7190/g.16368  ORF Transcript_7190/g.16368 Transcript_7190/m.16368 type:complete len:84 (-) Transcript_7190:518-769(-)
MICSIHEFVYFYHRVIYLNPYHFIMSGVKLSSLRRAVSLKCGKVSMAFVNAVLKSNFAGTPTAISLYQFISWELPRTKWVKHI